MKSHVVSWPSRRGVATVLDVEETPAPRSERFEPQKASGCPGATPVIEHFAAFLLALEDDDSVEMTDELSGHLDAVSEAIRFL